MAHVLNLLPAIWLYIVINSEIKPADILHHLVQDYGVVN
jgi:hypothetical protein